ncbi:MAG: S49 family peptidase, partial [Rhodobacteraceae bacterium]|nr:S49 family peptidase [Paracoccaceae bacterium]
MYADGDNPAIHSPLYTIDSAGAAVVHITGHLTKGPTSFGGTSNVRTRQALRIAGQDPEVKGVLLMIDSPGGTVAGHKPMADEIAKLAKIKPVHGHAEDSMHSAALWAGVQTSFLTASEMTEVGSIGVVTTVYDYSEQFEKAGVKAHVISTGDYKGAFTPGSEVTDEMIAEVQARIDEVNEHFIAAVAKGRGMRKDSVAKLATGQDWMALKAKELGLIDAVMTDEQALTRLRRTIQDREAKARREKNNRAT